MYVTTKRQKFQRFAPSIIHFQIFVNYMCCEKQGRWEDFVPPTPSCPVHWSTTPFYLDTTKITLHIHKEPLMKLKKKEIKNTKFATSRATTVSGVRITQYHRYIFYLRVIQVPAAEAVPGQEGYSVLTIRSLFIFPNRDFSGKLDKNGPYLVPILTKKSLKFSCLQYSSKAPNIFFQP